MPAVQQHFQAFHDRIKLDDDDEKAKLREKRETLLKALRAGLGADVPTFENFNQGSYSMHTGVRPLDGNFDIDVGLVFDCSRDKYPDPVELKRKVRDALDSKGRTVLVRRPCVTVNYMRDGETDYHVDLAIYVKRTDGKVDLAKGKENSEASLRTWEVSDPKGLTEAICAAFTKTEDLAQYRRCIRYLKRWRNVQFSNGGAPLSIALTVAALRWFKPKAESSGRPADLLALLDWVDVILANFTIGVTGEGAHERLQVMLPVQPRTDLMQGMTKAQMGVFKTKLEGLRDALRKAYHEDLPEDACKLLNKQFGDDFKVPEKSETGKKVAPAVVGTGHSA